MNRAVSPCPSATLRQQKAVEGFQPACCTFFKLVVLRDSRLLAFWLLMNHHWMPGLLKEVIFSTTGFHDSMD